MTAESINKPKTPRTDRIIAQAMKSAVTDHGVPSKEDWKKRLAQINTTLKLLLPVNPDPKKPPSN